MRIFVFVNSIEFMNKLSVIWSFIGRHKYWVVTVIFLLIIGVFDENSLIRRFEHRREIHALKTEIERYRQRYEEDSKMLKEITGNKDALEKVARERYLMKQENEDIFVFQKDTEKK